MIFLQDVIDEMAESFGIPDYRVDELGEFDGILCGGSLCHVPECVCRQILRDAVILAAQEWLDRDEANREWPVQTVPPIDYGRSEQS